MTNERAEGLARRIDRAVRAARFHWFRDVRGWTMSEIKALNELRILANNNKQYWWSHMLLDHLDSVQAEIADRYIKLPTDKNGNVIHVGDMVKHADGDVYEVLGVDNDGVRQGVFINTGDGGYPIDSWCASGMELYKPRTIEDVLREFAEKHCNIACSSDFKDCERKSALADEIADCADEIRELLSKAGD